MRFDDKARSEANTLLLIWDLPDCKPGVRAHVKEYQFSYSQERSSTVHNNLCFSIFAAAYSKFKLAHRMNQYPLLPVNCFHI